MDTKLSTSLVIASSNDGNVPTNTVDGSLGTRWSAQGDGQWIRYTLSSQATITSLKIAWYKGDQRKTKFDIQTSTDANVWKTVYSGTSSGTTLNLETYDITDSIGNYVRIVGHGNTENNWNSITETQIFGTIASPTPVPTPTPGTLPSQVLNLTNWKLTLPFDTSHAGSPDEITQPELSTFYDSNYFCVNSTGNGIVFTAPCGGYTTGGSSYPRSELREMINNGTSNANWSTTSGLHTMEIKQAITHLPVVKPHVVAGQIHDASDDVTVFRLEGSKLFIDFNGTAGPTLTSNYKLGDIFTCKFVAGSAKIGYYYNGNLVYTYSKSASGCYFKSGCYTQSNTSKGDSPTAYGQVVVYGLTVTHS